VLLNLAATRAGARGAINFGGYSNPDLDKLIDEIGVATDPTRRNELLDRAAGILRHDVAYVPLHQQEMLWAARDGVTVEQMPDGTLPLRLVRTQR
jgi:peptide/nickel transport system substrate-binding protein